MLPEAEAPADERLVQLAREGDDEAFTALVRRHQRRILALASRFSRDSHSIDDLAQQIFVRVWQKLGQFRGDAPFEHWLSRVAVHACYDWLRKQRRRGTEVGLEHAEQHEHQADAGGAEAARELVTLALAELSPPERLILTLLELEERSVREIAKLTGWSESNVKVRAFRARKALKTIVEKLQP